MTDNIVDDSMQQLATASNYGFSAVSLDALGAAEYTLATIAVDLSGSVAGWERELEKCVKTIVESCQDSPRADNLLLRVITFDNNLKEVHGFRLLSDINPDEYANAFQVGGSTALCDAVQSAVEASASYAELLRNQDYDVNAVVYVLTDGCENASGATANSVRNAIDLTRKQEKLQSIATILIGVGYGDGGFVAQALDEFKTKTNMTQFVDLTELFNKQSPAKALAKLAGYVSRSISTTSQALSTGSSTAASSQLTF